MPFTDPRGVPASTYRLQLRKEFPFADAARVVPYLDALGVSHCYLSPILMSAPGSTHGYDVNDYHRIETDLGGRGGFEALATAARARDMGILLDFVPNHMGIEGSSNRWWQDVLECGPYSPHADFFDIDWRDHSQSERPRVLVPILDNQYGVVLEAGRFALRFNPAAGTLAVHYEDLRLPVNPGTYSDILAGAAREPGCAGDARVVLEKLASDFRALPRGDDGPIPRGPREELKRQLAVAAAKETVLRAVTGHLETINGHGKDPRSVDRLDEIISDQHYRLAHWKTGAHEVNYRRFFAIDTLIGLRMENPKVFEETHRLMGGLVRDNLASGLRVDHIDGLRNPLEYLERVQALALRDGATATSPFYVVVEKILAGGEELDSAWPTHGTTGYEFIRQLANVFVNPAAEQKFTRLYGGFTGCAEGFADVVYANKRHVLEEMFANAVIHLGHQVATLSSADRRWRDLTRHELVVAIREIMAALGVYRIYRRTNAECRPADAREIERACSEALRRNPNRDPQGFEFVRDLLIGRYPPPSATLDFRVSLWRWVLTFQQYTGAVMAKAVEDTAYYVYNRLIALNEVGGDPAAFGGTVAEFHAANARRRETTPHSLLATSTHDTKIGEDGRARLYVLSELAGRWADWVNEWRELNQRFKTNVNGRLAPDANEEYRIYQTLLACWPPDGFEPDDLFRQRLREHVRKAVNEAKVNTHWFHPSEAWLEACDRFMNGVLSPATGGEFLASFGPKAQRLAHLGLVNTLAQVALKITSPGVPDIYQGCEGWNLSLVDPDNRRLIEWSGKEAALAPLRELPWRRLLRNWKDGAVKVRLTHDLLRFRRQHLALFQSGGYEPLSGEGGYADRLIVFTRRHADEALCVVVPRLTASLGCPPTGLVWEDTSVTIPAGRAGWRDVLTGREWVAGESTALADLFSELPLAVLWAKP
ncbi:MAG: malto-oligosyltrehalose synthase [Opitutaceae bacterium]